MQTINLSLYKKTITPMLWAKQQEVGRKFQVVFAEDIPEGVTFSVWYSGASGAGNYAKIGDASAFHIEGNTVTVELIAQMLNNAGEGKLCLIMTGCDGLQLGTWNIPYAAEAVPGMGSHPAEQYYQALRKLEEAAEAAVEAAEDAAERAAQAAVDVSLSAVCYTKQEATEEQKAQARKNIGLNAYVTPEMLGAVGDGVTDDTAALQAAFDASNIVLCAGNYYITSGIWVRSNTTAFFNGVVTHASVSKENHGYFFHFNGVSNINIFGGTFISTRDKEGVAPGSFTRVNNLSSNVSFFNAYNDADNIYVCGAKTNNLDNTYARHATNITLENCDFQNAIMGVYTDYVDNLKMLNCTIALAPELSGGDHCVYISDCSNNILLDGCTFTGDAHAGQLVHFYIQNANDETKIGVNHIVRDCTIIAEDMAIYSDSDHLKLYNCHIECKKLFSGGVEREVSFYNCTIKCAADNEQMTCWKPMRVRFIGCDIYEMYIIMQSASQGFTAEFDGCRLENKANTILYVYAGVTSGTFIMRNCSVVSTAGREVIVIKGAPTLVDIANCDITKSGLFLWVDNGDGSKMVVKFSTLNCGTLHAGAEAVKFLFCYDKDNNPIG